MTVELKNDLAIKGTLHSVDQYLNIKLNNIRVVNEQKYPHLVRGSLPAPTVFVCHTMCSCSSARAAVANSISTVISSCCLKGQSMA